MINPISPPIDPINPVSQFQGANQDLMSTLLNSSFEMGTGIPRILQAYEGAYRQPVFNPSGNFFILTLPNQNYAYHINNPVKIKDGRLGDLELIILETIQQTPGIRTKNLLKLIQEKQPEVTFDILKNNIKRKLQDYIEFRGSQKKG